MSDINKLIAVTHAFSDFSSNGTLEKKNGYIRKKSRVIPDSRLFLTLRRSIQMLYIFRMSRPTKKDTPLVTFAHAMVDIYVHAGTLKDGKTTEGCSKKNKNFQLTSPTLVFIQVSTRMIDCCMYILYIIIFIICIMFKQQRLNKKYPDNSKFIYALSIIIIHKLIELSSMKKFYTTNNTNNFYFIHFLFLNLWHKNKEKQNVCIDESKQRV